jgi:hypothetical protein
VDWSTIQAAIKSAIATALALPDVGAYQPIVWEDSSASSTWHAPAQARVRLKLHEPTQVGQDGLYHTYDSDADTLLPVVAGDRTFFVSVKIRSHSQVPGGASEPVGVVAGKLRSRLQWPRVRALLDAAGVSVRTVRPTINASEPEDGRQVAMAIVDVVFNAVENDTDEGAEGGYFTKVALGGKAATDLSDIAEKLVGVGIPPPGEDPDP